MTETDLHKPVLVIGYGNSLRGDDGFGPHVASLLAQLVDPADVDILTSQQLTPDLAAQVAASTLTILIDARVGGEPGKIHHSLPLVPDRASPTFQHHITPETLAGVTHALYGVTPAIHLFTSEAVAFEVPDGLSTELQAAAEDVVQQILNLLADSS
ncbi:MAG: hydrogenase maturation protease [Anaerolineales bacterium]|nr:hydrogenase maturation protease [Anaerolineales bacterium]